MSSSRDRSERPYHHGDLRRSLVEAGLELLEQRGLSGISLRAAARRAGVSHAAPYHHFADKADLVEALAVECLAGFTATLQEAWNDTQGSSLHRLRAVGIAYVGYALERPERFRLMNWPEWHRRPQGQAATTGSDAPSPQLAARASFDVLLTAIRACQEDGLVYRGDADRIALAAWALVHGLAVLAIEGRVGSGKVGKKEGERLAHEVTEVFDRGLMAR